MSKASEEIALSIIHACKGDPARFKEAAAIIDQFKDLAVSQLNCDHEGYGFEKMGRCCFKCGAFMVDL